MSEPRNRSGGTRSLLAVSVSLCVLAVSASALAETSEIDSFQMAVTSQTKQDALAFIEAFPSSHLIGDLFDLLPSEVAQQVCTDLADGAPARAQSACNALQRAYAVAPIQPAAGPAPVDAQLTDAQVPATTSASVGTLPADDPASNPITIRRGGRGNDNAYWPTPTTPNATSAPSDSSGSSAGSSEGSLSNASGAGTSGSPSDSTSGDTASSGAGGSVDNGDASGSGPGQGGGLIGKAGDVVGGAVGAVKGAVGGVLDGG